MSSTFYIRILALFCTIFAIAVNNSLSKPTRHYGRCMIQGEIGFCQHRQQCWEKGENLSSSIRSSCPSQFRRDLICCRRPPQGITPATLRQLFPQPGTCGIYLDDFKDRIISGTIAGIKEFPWMALLRETNDGEEYTQLCGGSLIHERWILTAAHCVPHAKEAQYTFQVRLGEWNTTSSPDCQQIRNEQICAPPHMDINIDRIIVHEEYVEDLTVNPLVTNDIALLRLSRPVQFSEYVLPICLPAANSNDEYAYADYGMDISGWGLTEHIRFGGSPIKMKAVLNTWSMEKCRKIHSQLVSGQLCAGGETLSGTCRGDSGGPLMHPLEYDESNNKAYFLAGIVSLGSKTCNNNGQPMIFTKVEHYVPWITGTITANT